MPAASVVQMSEYQYYEFRSIDRPLSARQMDELRKVSSRARITPGGFVNDYNYGDFRGDPDKLIDKYFDAFLHLANWGTRWLMLRASGWVTRHARTPASEAKGHAGRLQRGHQMIDWGPAGPRRE